MRIGERDDNLFIFGRVNFLELAVDIIRSKERWRALFESDHGLKKKRNTLKYSMFPSLQTDPDGDAGYKKKNKSF